PRALLQLLEGDGLSGQFGGDRPAQVGVLVVDAHLAGVAGVVADGHGLTDVGGQHRADVAGALKADAVALDDAGGRSGEQQQVEILAPGRGARDPPGPDPAGGGGLSGLGVHPGVVVLDQVALDHCVELLQAQGRW
ncbi:hypothetical protein PCS70012_02353, partial [Streptococcus pneumoniae PCS70012]